MVDPFAGGGSIPLEALRLGCETFASDLNPVACLILKVLLEDIPRHGPQLAAALRRVGAEIKQQAEKELAKLYPPDPDGATPIAYLWARTVQCEAPNCGAEIPLVRSLWLCKKANRRRALQPRVERPRDEPPRVVFDVCEPKTEQEVPAGTVTRAKATCLCCGTVLPPERRAQLPPEWTAVDTATTESKAREFLQSRFEACYPFHPATLSVFQRKWQALPQYQQTRGTLAMLAQWISWAYRDGFTHARREPLITLGSAPLEVREFRSIVLGQLGESRLVAALEADIAGAQAHARVLDMDTRGALRDIHRRVGTAILFESSGGQVDKVAHLPELRFALGEPDVDTTSVDTAALALEARAYYLRRAGSDGFQSRHQPTLKKVVSDRRASLDESSDIQPTMHTLVKNEFDRGRTLPVFPFRLDGEALPDSPTLTLVVMEPETEWKGEDALRRHSRASGDSGLRERLATWTRQRGTSPRLYPGALVWCVKKPGREYRDKVELALAWKRVQGEIEQGTLGGDFDRTERAEVLSKVKEAQEEAQDEVWASYRYVILADNQEPDGLKVIDLGAGHASASETLCGRVISTLKSQALLNETVGAGYLERRWPPALKEAGAWPLASLRQSFLNGALTRLMDPDAVLRHKIVEFVAQGDFGLASGHRPDGTYDRIWYREAMAPEEVTFEADVFLLTKTKAQALKAKAEPVFTPVPSPESGPQPLPWPESGPSTVPTPEPIPASYKHTIRLVGTIPPEVWNRLGTKVLPKFRTGNDLRVDVDLSVSLNTELVQSMVSELRQILQDLDLEDRLRIEQI